RDGTRHLIGSEMNDRTNALAFVHQIEGLVDVFQPHGMRDEGIQRDFTLLRLFHITGQLGAALDATEGTATPDPTGDQLERTGADLLPSSSHPDDGGFTPTLVAALQRR